MRAALVVAIVVGASQPRLVAADGTTSASPEVSPLTGPPSAGPGLQCLALNIYHEARGEGEQGKAAVAIVTLNRVISRHFPDTLCEVVWQRGQFSWTRDGRPDRPLEVSAWRRALKVATRVYRQGALFDRALWRRLRGVTHYHSIFVQPGWAYRLRPAGQIGEHIFYRS